MNAEYMGEEPAAPQDAAKRQKMATLPMASRGQGRPTQMLMATTSHHHHHQQQGYAFSGLTHPCTKFGPCVFANKCRFFSVPQEACRYFLKGTCRNSTGTTPCRDLHVSWEELRTLGYQG
eukprot:NODE_6245_length_463_cov_84.893720_g4711_i3.p2 GENE.NODE_6245_length_463_cov_84.893720_g4711_i3~~NODE_6245_length_463_cov_84.893720_g4711_i3.p2  ORF type:complete len:120 (+),score=19.64 NODE_6245_length_463_cov_84.893720_g4711_i3:3-362(+)